MVTPPTPRLIEQTITTPDGARLATYAFGPPEATVATPTVIFAHGWALSHRSWMPVVRTLAATPQPPRMMLWDQRGHGESTFAGGRRTTREQSVRALGEDLNLVLSRVPAQSPIVLAGHSMGGMTVMAFAGLHPDVVRTRVRGAVLVSTASGKLRGLGRPALALMRALTHVPVRPGRAVPSFSQQRTAFGRGARRNDVVETARQIGSTRLATTGAFYSALMAHDELASLSVLNEVGTTVLCGDRDRLTPLKLNEALAAAMPDAQLRVLAGKGHMLTYEATDAVVEAILARVSA